MHRVAEALLERWNFDFLIRIYVFIYTYISTCIYTYTHSMCQWGCWGTTLALILPMFWASSRLLRYPLRTSSLSGQYICICIYVRVHKPTHTCNIYVFIYSNISVYSHIYTWWASSRLLRCLLHTSSMSGQYMFICIYVRVYTPTHTCNIYVYICIYSQKILYIYILKRSS